MTFFTKFSLRNPVAIVILTLLVMIGGYFSAIKFKQESMPDIAIPYILLTAIYPGASPNEVLNQVTIPMENALRNVEGVKNVSSQSMNSASSFQLEFGFNDDMKDKKAKVEEAINGVTLPNEVERPKVNRISFESAPMYYSSIVAAGSTTAKDLQDIIKSKVIPTLQGLDGVAKVETFGLQDEGVFIQLDSKKMAEKRVSFQQISQVLQANNLNIPLGEANFNKVKEPVSITGNIKSIDDIKNLIVLPKPEVRIQDIAEIKQGKDLTVISRTDGKPSVAVNVVKSGDANTVEVSKHIQSALDDIKKDGKVDTVLIYDAANDVKESVMSMAREGGLGALFASILILFFLRNIRATIIAIVSIPLSIFVAFILLKSFTDVTLNIMTLGGMAVATGRVVDDSIVVIENIVRRLQSEKISKALLLEATKEVGAAITSSTITTVAVFAPLGLLQGIIGKIFAPFALTVVFSLIASLFVALTVVPLMAWLLMKRNVSKEHQESNMSRVYQRVLNWSLNHKITVLIIACVLFLGSLPLAGIVGVSFIPESDQKFVSMKLTMPKGTELSVVDDKARALDDELRKSHEVISTQVTVGSSMLDMPVEERSNIATWFVHLNSDTNVDDFMAITKQKLNPGTDSAIDLSPVGGGPGGSGIMIFVSGGSKADIKNASEMITNAVKKIPGTDNVRNNLQEGTKGVEVQVRPEDALKNGLSVAQASGILRPYLSITKIGRIGDGRTASELYMTLKGESITSPEDIGRLSLPTPLGKIIQVKDIADVNEMQLPGSLQLRNGEEYASITGSITDKDASKVNSELLSTLKNLSLPSAVKYELDGSNKQIQDMFSDMTMAMLVALGMVYIVMVVSFGEARAPFAILFSLPFALIGGLLGALISKEPISISSLIGFLMLIGVVVTNAIVLVDRVQHQIKNGMIIREALLESGGTRLRPILMTAIATICALLPLALGLSGGAIISKGLAVIVIGGLTTSTLLTLVIVPVMFELLHFKRARRERSAVEGAINQSPVLNH